MTPEGAYTMHRLAYLGVGLVVGALCVGLGVMACEAARFVAERGAEVDPATSGDDDQQNADDAPLTGFVAPGP